MTWAALTHCERCGGTLASLDGDFYRGEFTADEERLRSALRRRCQGPTMLASV